MLRQNVLKTRQSLKPAIRGALYYGAFFGAIGMFAPFLSVYYVEIGLSGAQLGVLFAIAPLMIFVFAPLVSQFADRRAWRIPLLMAFLFGTGISVFLLPIPKLFGGIIITMIVHSVMQSPLLALGDGLVARMASRYMISFGQMRLWGSIIFATTSIGFGFVWEQTGYGMMFLVAGLFFFVVALIPLMLEEDGRPMARTVEKPWAIIRRDPGLLVLLLASFWMGFAMKMDFNFCGVHMAAIGGGEAMIGMLMGLAAISEIPTMRYSDGLLRRFGVKRVLMSAYAVLVVSYVGYGLSQAPMVMLFFALLKGLGFGLLLTATIVATDRRAGERWSASLQGILSSVMFGIAHLFASPVSGFIYDAFGSEMVFYVAAGSVLLAFVIFTFGYRAKEQY